MRMSLFFFIPVIFSQTAVKCVLLLLTEKKISTPFSAGSKRNLNCNHALLLLQEG